MMVTRAYADVELLLVGYLTPLFTDSRVVTELPASTGKGTDPSPGLFPSSSTTPGKQSIIQVVRVAGLDSDAIDSATVDIDVYSPDRLTATQVAAEVRAYLRASAAGYTNGTATITRVTTVVGPGWRPYDNTTVRRVGATYQVDVHNH